jgi:hypothetical protein
MAGQQNSRHFTKVFEVSDGRRKRALHVPSFSRNEKTALLPHPADVGGTREKRPEKLSKQLIPLRDVVAPHFDDFVIFICFNCVVEDCSRESVTRHTCIFFSLNHFLVLKATMKH